MNSIQEVTDQLLIDLGFDNLPELKKAEVLEQIQDMVDEEVLYVLVSNLTEDQLKHINDEVESFEGDEDDKAVKMLELAQEALPNHQELIADALSDLYERIKADAMMAKEAVSKK